MRTMLVNTLSTCLSCVAVLAGELNVAVIQFPEEKSLVELQSAFATVNLFEITNADRTRTSHPYLKGGTVLFAQRFAAAPGGSFFTSTRLKNFSSDVTGRLNPASIAVSISLMEGSKGGLRTFQRKIYAGSGPLSAAPQVLGFRQVRGRSPNVLRDQTRMQSYFLTIVVVAQYAP